ncbi:hypothetical protein ASF61_09065 [Duganella sp. Leaf126]|uniref:hypothetical protein n=1 Tax=Duganella sp. Leaf126 TaxID=1736266 RepID=UPI0006F52928|nr:hypothetical protein [Duganella sp. Leaf126]KQQ33242.1 hypothetical protein ASF61_09065 [Duganella sp. Leaf126]
MSAMSAKPAASFANALIERHRFEEAFVFWHARHADDGPGALATLASLSRQAAREHQHQLAAGYHAMHTALRRGSRWYPGMLAERLLPLYEVAVTSDRLCHDAAQLEYLHQLGVLGDAFPPIIARYRRLAARLQARTQPRPASHPATMLNPPLEAYRRPWWEPQRQPQMAPWLEPDRGTRFGSSEHSRHDRRTLLSSDEQDAIDEVYDRIIHLRPTPCVAQAFSGHALAAVRRAPPGHGITVIDDFLSSEALDELWRFCLQSTIWFSEHGHGRLGATYDNGFNCPLLVQIAQGVFGDGRQLLELKAGKHPPRLPGESLHGAAGGWQLQIWLTPDTANLDSASGGMVIRDRDGRTRHIAYRQNRAVLFDPRLAHGAASCDFRDDHAGARITMTMLYA